MSVATIQPVLPVGKPRMENDRKRAAATGDLDDSLAPPLKKQVTMSNGAGSGEVADAPKFGSSNSSWQVDLEAVQKDAILRQMKEYKREKQGLEKTVTQLEERSKHYKENLRTVDTWWKQLVDEVIVIFGESATASIPDTTALLPTESQDFQEHLASRAESIKSVISAIYSRHPAPTPEIECLQRQVNELLAKEKDYINKCQRAEEERDALQQQLDEATLRYMMAEKRLDRAKSQTVTNLEKQSSIGATVVKPEIEDKVNGEVANGVKNEEAISIASEEAERERAEALATATKAKEQLKQLEEQNAKLTAELTKTKARLDSLSDDDYAGTELFKIMKLQLEESLNKINDLEATHIQLREEAKKMQAERTAYRTKVNDEALTMTSSTEQLLAARDADLQRIRAARDDALFKLSTAEQSLSDRKATVDAATSIASAREARIDALESEVERLRVRCGEIHAEISEDELNVDDPEVLRIKIADLKKECKSLEGELPSIEQAYKKAQAAAATKYASHEKMDDQLAMLKVGKAKADQKYFGMMKYKEQLEAEVATLRKAEKTSSGIITSLKDSDARTKELVVNLERQAAEHIETIERMNQDHFGLEQKASQASMAAAGFQSQVIKLKEALGEKDSLFSSSESSSRELQREVEALKSRLDSEQKEVKKWKHKASSNDSDELKNLQRVAYCSCDRGLKDTAITVCGHVVCNQCVTDRIATRQRKCPICMKAFGNKDFLRVHLA